MVQSIVDTVSNWFKPVSDWISEHNDSWFFWVGFLLLALFIFGVVMEILKKNR